MFEYRIIKANDEALKVLWKENRELTTIYNDKMYFKKKIISKSEREEKQASKSNEFIEFAKLYWTIKKTWLSDDKLINKYNKLAKEWKHTEIMDWLARYIKKIKAENTAEKFILMASTFINQNRYTEEFIVLENRVWFTHKWILPLLQEVEEEKAQLVLDKIRQREKQTNKEITEWVAINIINTFKNN